MKTPSVFARVTALAILIALVLSAFPTTGVLAGSNNEQLENKWDQLVTNFDKQGVTHKSAHKWVENWLKSSKDSSEKAEIQKHLSICNSALAAATTIVANHSGFNATGKVTDRALAIKSIKDLSYYLQRHAGSIRNLRGHLND